MRRFCFAWATPCALIGLAALCSACAPAQDDAFQSGERTAVIAEPIQGGYVDDNDTSVVGIQYMDMGSYEVYTCSGSLLAPNVVLTAQHCVAALNNEVSGGVSCTQTTFGTKYSASNMTVTTHTEINIGSNLEYHVDEIVVPPDSSKVCGDDQAILILSSAVSDATAKPLVPRVDSTIAHGDVYSAVGYGQTSDSTSAPSGQRRRRDQPGAVAGGRAITTYKATEGEHIDQDLQGGRDDTRTAGRARDQLDAAIAQHDGGRHRRDRALAWCRPVRIASR